MTNTDPLRLELDVPVLRTNDPLAPDLPAFEVVTDTDPLELLDP